MNNYIVYMHISPSGKRYIGITSMGIKKRWANGKGYRENEYFTRAIEKYGWDNFKHIIIARGLSEDEAKWLEIELIREWDTTDRSKGYNITLGGEGGNGWIPSEETKKKMSEAKKGENNPNYGKYGENHHSYGKNHSEETKKKISEANSGNIAWNKGRTDVYSEETKKKMSEAKKGKYKGKNNPMYGKNHTEEAKERNRQAHLGKGLGKNNSNAKAVICITNGRIFCTVTEGAKYYKINPAVISACCRGRQKTAGKLLDGTKLVWRYIEIIEL